MEVPMVETNLCKLIAKSPCTLMVGRLLLNPFWGISFSGAMLVSERGTVWKLGFHSQCMRF